MTINELKGELQELAIKRTKEHYDQNGLEFETEHLFMPLDELFVFRKTDEGIHFWWGVNLGKITELPK